MDSFFSSFCKVDFVCYQGEPNWLGWLILIPFFLFIAFFVFNLVFGQVLEVNEWFDDIKAQAEMENATFKDKIKYLIAIIIYLAFYILIIGIPIFILSQLLNLDSLFD